MCRLHPLPKLASCNAHTWHRRTAKSKTDAQDTRKTHVNRVLPVKVPSLAALSIFGSHHQRQENAIYITRRRRTAAAAAERMRVTAGE